VKWILRNIYFDDVMGMKVPWILSSSRVLVLMALNLQVLLLDEMGG
jgi:hypothetical protein